MAEAGEETRETSEQQAALATSSTAPTPSKKSDGVPTSRMDHGVGVHPADLDTLDKLAAAKGANLSDQFEQVVQGPKFGSTDGLTHGIVPGVGWSNSRRMDDATAFYNKAVDDSKKRLESEKSAYAPTGYEPESKQTGRADQSLGVWNREFAKAPVDPANVLKLKDSPQFIPEQNQSQQAAIRATGVPNSLALPADQPEGVDADGNPIPSGGAPQTAPGGSGGPYKSKAYTTFGAYMTGSLGMPAQYGKDYDDAVLRLQKAQETGNLHEAEAAQREVDLFKNEIVPGFTKLRTDHAEEQSVVKRELDSTRADYAEMAKDAQKAVLDKRSYIEKNPLSGVLFAISAIFGGALSGRTGQPNQGLQMLDNEINRDLARQKYEIDLKKDKVNMQGNLLAQMRQKYGDNETAYQMAELRMRTEVGEKMGLMAAQTDNQKIKDYNEQFQIANEIKLKDQMVGVAQARAVAAAKAYSANTSTMPHGATQLKYENYNATLGRVWNDPKAKEKFEETYRPVSEAAYKLNKVSNITRQLLAQGVNPNMPSTWTKYTGGSNAVQTLVDERKGLLTEVRLGMAHPIFGTIGKSDNESSKEFLRKIGDNVTNPEVDLQKIETLLKTMDGVLQIAAVPNSIEAYAVTRGDRKNGAYVEIIPKQGYNRQVEETAPIYRKSHSRKK